MSDPVYNLDQKKLAQRIKEIRLMRGLSQKHMASALYLDRAGYSRRESGLRKIDAIELAKIAIILGVTAGDLLNGP